MDAQIVPNLDSGGPFKQLLFLFDVTPLVLEHFLPFWNKKISKAHFTVLLPQICNQPSSWALFPFGEEWHLGGMASPAALGKRGDPLPF